MGRIIIKDYNPKWKTYFDDIKKILEKQLKGLIVGIEHVGSTSVEGLSAKPIIDIDII